MNISTIVFCEDKLTQHAKVLSMSKYTNILFVLIMAQLYIEQKIWLDAQLKYLGHSQYKGS